MMRVRFAFDILGEGLSAFAGRKVRSSLTVLGIALGVTAITSMIGMSAASSASISSEFDELKATRIDLAGLETVTDYDRYVGQLGLARAAKLQGAVAAGATFRVGEETLPLSTREHANDGDLDLLHVDVVATDGEALEANGINTVTGRSFDVGHVHRADRVALVGDLVASRLGLHHNGRQAIWVDGVAFHVMGTITTTDLTSTLPLSVVIPATTARAVGWGTRLQPPLLTVRTRLGAADVVGAQAALALDPSGQGRLEASIPPSPSRLEDAIETQTRNQLLALASVSIVVGAIGVSNTTLVGVLERRHEIGVRRAVGASRSAVVMQFLTESLILGLAGGVLGALLGFVVSLAASAVNDWVPAIPPALALLGPLVGSGVGVLAGAYPAMRAAQIEPITALQ